MNIDMHDIPKHKWERIQSELNQAQKTIAILTNANAGLANELHTRQSEVAKWKYLYEQWRSVADELASGLRTWHDSEMDSKHKAIVSYEKLKGESTSSLLIKSAIKQQFASRRN